MGIVLLTTLVYYTALNGLPLPPEYMMYSGGEGRYTMYVPSVTRLLGSQDHFLMIWLYVKKRLMMMYVPHK